MNLCNEIDEFFICSCYESEYFESNCDLENCPYYSERKTPLLIKGDCMEVLSKIGTNSVDLILCDLPYGTTAHYWDKIINFKELWKEYERIIRDDGVIILFATQPFTSQLICSNIDNYRYSYIWEKESPTGFLNSNYAPLKIYEDIVIFSKATVGSLSKNPIRYFPQGVKENGCKKNNPNSKFRKQNGYFGSRNVLNSSKLYKSRTGFPTNILYYPRDKEKYHPTQKPVKLLEYLIKTYSKENEIVLDNCMGSGSTGVACNNTNRMFIGIEKDDKYFAIAQKRIMTSKKEQLLFEFDGEK